MRLKGYPVALCLFLFVGLAAAQIKGSRAPTHGKASGQSKIDFPLFPALVVIPFDVPVTEGQKTQAVQGPTQKKLLPLDRVARLVERLEAAEAGRRAGLTEEERKKELKQATTEMKAFLKAHPENVDAIILSVRLARFQEVEGLDIDDKNFEEQFAQARRALVNELASRLDRTLAMQPNRAEAYYWKARIYSTSQPGWFDERLMAAPAELQEAIRNTRRAVELAPDNVAYKEALAFYLIMDGKDDDAAELMRSVAGGQHILSLLLADRMAVPIPAGATLWAEESASLAAMSMSEGPVQDYPMLRAQVYVLAAPASEVVTTFQKRWPEFQFFEIHKEKSDEEGTLSYSQVLRGPTGALRPAASKREVPGYDEGFVTEGVTLMLTEFRRKAPGDVRGVPVGEVFCILSIFNGRTTAER